MNYYINFKKHFNITKIICTSSKMSWVTHKKCATECAAGYKIQVGHYYDIIVSHALLLINIIT